MTSTVGRRQIVFDSRLPVGDNMSTNDPMHPRNIVLLAANTEAQAAADQRYDINPPPRVEPFVSLPLSSLSIPKSLHLPFLVNVFIVCILFVLVMQIKYRIVKITLAVGIIFFLHQIINQFQGRCKSSTST
jgi:hypothetical protein